MQKITNLVLAEKIDSLKECIMKDVKPDVRANTEFRLGLSGKIKLLSWCLGSGCILVIILALFSHFAFAYTPPSDIDMRWRYNMTNTTYIQVTNLTATNVTADHFYGDGTGISGITIENATNAIYATNATYATVANQSYFWDDLDSPSGFVGIGSWASSYLYGLFVNVSGDINASAVYQAGLQCLDTGDEANLNVNKSSYWDDLDSPANINAGDITDDGTYILYADNSSLNVNSSNQSSFWDALDSPSDITSVGTLTGLTMGGILNMDSNNMTNFFAAACSANQFVSDIAEDGSFTCGSPVASANLTGSKYAYANATNGIYFNDTEALVSLKVNGSIYADNWDGETSQANLNVNASDHWDLLETPLNFTSIGTWGVSYLYGLFINVSGSVNATSIYQAGLQCLDTGDEANLNVNKSNYWDDLDSPSDINAADITDDGTYIASADEAILNVNSSNQSMYWDGLNTPADINAADITDDGTYLKDLVEDTSPQLGGNLDGNAFNISVDVGDRFCLDATCTRYVTSNSTTLILKG